MDSECVRERELYFYFFSFFGFFIRFMEIGSQIFVGAEGKVGLRDESYA